MSAGVAAPGDISLPGDGKPQEPDGSRDLASKSPTSRRNFLNLRQLNCLAVAVVLAVSGMVCTEYIAFTAFSVAYTYFLSKVAFPPTSPVPPPLLYGSKIFRLYVFTGAVIGLYLPVAYILEGIFEGDKEGIKAAAPHVFLLVSQVFMEGVTFSGGFSLPVRVFVPVFYNSVRISSILEWMRREMSAGGSSRRMDAGKALAFTNMAFWSFNLFGFLLPSYLPKAFKIYYSKPEIKD